MEIIIIIWFLIFTKLLLFWLWLWQLKEYRLDRFRAHFESRGVRKIISSFWRLKHPKFTKKIILIFLTCLAAEALLIFYFSLSWAIFLTILFVPLLILFFQIPTSIWQRNIIKKATQKRAKFNNLMVIGITGSYGKTSVKEFLTTILSSKFKVLSTPAHQNTDIAIAQLILKKLTQDIEIFIVEMAAYKKGEIASPCQIIRPKIGIVTGVNEQHLSTFETMENLLSAEGGKELIESLPEEGMIFLNAKNKYCQELYQEIKIKKFLYGENTPLLMEDLEGAKLVAKELGMSDEGIERVCQKIKNKLPGIEIKKGINGITVIDATYSANPDGVISHLDYLKTWPGKKVIVIPCLIELGKASRKIHKEIGKKIGEVCGLCIITSRERFREISEGAAEKGMKSKNILFTDKPKEIFEKIKNFCQSAAKRPPRSIGDVVLLESRVPSQLISLLVISD